MPLQLDDKPGLVWFRRDLRLDANPAWAAATAAHNEVLALFVIEPALMDAASPIRRDQLLAHLHALDEELQALGGALVVRLGPADAAMPSAIADSEASALYFNADAGPFATKRDRATVKAAGIPTHISYGQTAHEPGLVLTQKGLLSKVFTPFYKVWQKTPLTPWPEGGTGKPASLDGVAIPSPDGPPRQEAGEAAAFKRLVEWNERVADYKDTRDKPGLDGTSNISADLKFGTLAARTVLDVVSSESFGGEAFIRQISWRDWWAHTLAELPHIANRAIRPEYDGISWRDDDEGFERWATGTTGYPIVDAGMRELVQTGWLHGRVRMLCASFLVKDLLIDWRRGERFFRHHLVDADLAQNAGNWQWVAGTGPDAAPYFRVFNPTTQAKKFDPKGDYVRRWVPELAALSAATIHDPGQLAPLDLAAAGVIIGDTYPAPIVDHAEARLRTLEVYKACLADGQPG